MQCLILEGDTKAVFRGGEFEQGLPRWRYWLKTKQNKPANAGRLKRCRFDPWVRKIPWRRRAWQPPAVFLPGESPWTEEPSGLQSTRLQRTGHDWSDLACTSLNLIWEESLVHEQRPGQSDSLLGSVWGPVRTPVLGDRWSQGDRPWELRLGVPCQGSESYRTVVIEWSTGIQLTRLESFRLVLVVKNPPANAGDIRDSGSIPGEGYGNPL